MQDQMERLMHTASPKNMRRDAKDSKHDSMEEESEQKLAVDIESQRNNMHEGQRQ